MLFSFGFCIFSIIVHIAPHATDLGISSAKAASILAVIGGTSIIGKVVMGYTVDRIGSKRVWIICFIIMAIALFCLGAAQELWILYVISIIFGCAYGAGASAQSPLIADLFGLGSHGVILGFGSFFFTIGASIGPLITGYVFDIFLIYKWAFLICGAIAILGCGLAISLKPVVSK
jgi:MFS family permease